MKISTPGIILINLISLMLISNLGFGQKLYSFTDDKNPKVYHFLNGDTIIIKLDSAFILNRFTYSIYNRTYLYAKKSPAERAGLFNKVMAIFDKQDSAQKVKEKYYQLLLARYDSLSKNSLEIANKTSDNLKDVSAKLKDSEQKLVETQSLLSDAQKKLADENRKRNAKAYTFGLWGILVGAVTTLVIIR